MHVPTFDQLMLPLFNSLKGCHKTTERMPLERESGTQDQVLGHALKELGGSGSIAEIDEKVGEDLGLSGDVLDLPHNSEKSNQTEFQYRLAWARTYFISTGGS